ncbi:MAG: hypothetical protein ACREIC_15280, partial [Limisphaerales bacterium]
TTGGQAVTSRVAQVIKLQYRRVVIGNSPPHVSRFKVGRSMLNAGCSFLVFLLFAFPTHAAPAADLLFRAGAEAYHNGDYPAAAAAFRQSAALRPACGTLQNLGNAEWETGQTGPAILAWEQALWLNPLAEASRNNLRFARKNAQLESPDLTWYEAVSAWLPLNGWGWLCALSLWLVVGMGLLPGIFRVRKAAWHQAVAAFGLALFLLSIPAQIGIETLSRLGFVIQKNTPLRLTPTAQAQYLTRLAAGEPARVERVHGQYLLLRTNRALGWVEKSQFGLVTQVR